MNDILKCGEICRHFAAKERLFQLLLAKWSILQEMVAILKIPYESTVKLQTADYTMSDFYGNWNVMKVRLSKLQKKSSDTTQLAANLVQTLEKRRAQLLDNTVMMATTFLDPRFKTDIETEPEKVHLVKLFLADLNQRVKSGKSAEKTSSEENEMEMSSSDDDDDYTLLDKYYAKKGLQSTSILECTTARSTDITESSNDETAILQEIESYQQITTGIRLKSRESVLNFWQGQKTTLPLLYEIAKIIYAIPPTQATVERAFSALNIIFDKSRCNLRQELLENILLLALNKQTLAKINLIEMDELKKRDEQYFQVVCMDK